VDKSKSSERARENLNLIEPPAALQAARDWGVGTQGFAGDAASVVAELNPGLGASGPSGRPFCWQSRDLRAKFETLI